MPRRLPLVLATLAALLGAPSFASAAGNELSAPSASPTSGSITTVFVLGVSYDGKFPASVVTVSVGGMTLPMARIGGTAHRGAWSVSTLLPAGAWVPTFTSSSLRGNTASITGPLIAVGGPASASTPMPTMSGGTPDRGSVPEGPTGDAVGPGSTADPVNAPAGDEPGVAPAAEPEPAASQGARPTSGGGGGDDGGTSIPAGPESSPAAGGESQPIGGAAADEPAADSSTEAAVVGVDRDRGGHDPAAAFARDGLLNMVLLIGLSGVAAVAILGAALLILGRRRADRDEARVPAVQPPDTEALLERRTLRQAKVRLSDDPIVAALGVDERVAARRQRRRASQDATGPGKRPASRRR